jgi:malate dehydrogenase (oxaloacetate-decarboxylating)
VQTDKTFQIRIPQEHGNFARLIDAIAASGVSFGNIKTRHIGRRFAYRDITIEFDTEAQFQRTLAAIQAVPGIVIDAVVDEVLSRHQGGKLAYHGRSEVQSLAELREIYTPGVAKVCMAIKAEPSLARLYTMAGNTVAVVSNGTRVLGLGDIGPRASMPVMESKALFYGQFVGLNAVAIVLEAPGVDEFVDTVARMAPSFAGIHLEDIRSPDCIEIERQLIERLEIPVMHDDQHGTAVVAVAAMRNMLNYVSSSFAEATIAQVGLGAAGLAIAQLATAAGAKSVIGADPDPNAGTRARERALEVAELEDAMGRADLICCCTGRAGLLQPQMLRKGQLILALTNPRPEIEPAAAVKAGAALAVDGRNVNNLLCYPGLFKGAIAAGARSISLPMKLAAVKVIADAAREEEILPEPLDKSLHQSVAQAVEQVAREEAESLPRHGA